MQTLYRKSWIFKPLDATRPKFSWLLKLLIPLKPAKDYTHRPFNFTIFQYLIPYT